MNDTKIKYLNRNSFKTIALVSMLLDHIGSIIIYPIYVNACMVNGVEMMGELIPNKAKVIYGVYLFLRLIGRFAFPIFAFMLVEGFRYTHNRKKYFCRILLFAVISEIPFDLANTGRIFNIFTSNVLWTFAVAFIMMNIIEKYTLQQNNNSKRIITTILIVVLSAVCTIFSDCGFGGVFLIATMYLFKNIKKKLYWIGRLISICIMSVQFMWIQLFAFVALIILERYNGEKGRNIKFLFYIFYPVHLLILGLIALVL